MKGLIKRALARVGYRLQGTRYIPRHLLEPRYLRSLDLTDVVARRMFERGPALTFIQIGAFDGITADPLQKYIARYGWRGVMVEPQPRAAALLRELYNGNERIRVLQAAVGRQRETRPLFIVESDGVPAWAASMASFDRAHITKHEYLIPGIAGMIEHIPVDCVLFEDVLEQLGPHEIDLLQIDAEGDDAHLLSLFPFDRVKPAIIHWEIKNLSIAEREECFERLSRVGYRFAPSGDEDMMAVLAET